MRSWIAADERGRRLALEELRQQLGGLARLRAARAPSRPGARRGAARGGRAAACGRGAGRQSGRRPRAAAAARPATRRAREEARASRRRTTGGRRAPRSAARPCAAACSKAQRRPSNNVARSPACAGAPSSGRSNARWGLRAPQPSRPSGFARRYARRAATSGPYGAGAGVGGPAPQDDRVRALGQLLDEPRLAHACLARDEHERTVACACPVESLVESLELSVTPDERTLNGHWWSLGPAGGHGDRRRDGPIRLPRAPGRAGRSRCRRSARSRRPAGPRPRRAPESPPGCRPRRRRTCRPHRSPR